MLPDPSGDGEAVSLDVQEQEHEAVIAQLRHRLPFVWIRNRVGAVVLFLVSVAIPFMIAASAVNGLGIDRGSWWTLVIFSVAFGGFVWFVGTHGRFNNWMDRLYREEKEIRAEIDSYRSSLGMVRSIRRIRSFGSERGQSE